MRVQNFDLTLRKMSASAGDRVAAGLPAPPIKVTGFRESVSSNRTTKDMARLYLLTTPFASIAYEGIKEATITQSSIA